MELTEFIAGAYAGGSVLQGCEGYEDRRYRD